MREFTHILFLIDVFKTAIKKLPLIINSLHVDVIQDDLSKH